MKDKIISWIKRKVKESNSKGIVLGLSGGIDSAVAAALCSRALGREKVLALFMPCKSNPEDIRDAKLVARQLKVRTRLIDLTGPYESFLKVLPRAKKLAKNNLKPRLRMAALYYFANKLNYLVCGTGNKSELMAGYFTKYGDGGVDILPIGDLLKRQVRQLARELGLPGKIIAKPPTAGLWKGQTDEGEMGITYDVLDEILSGILSGKKRKGGLKETGKVKAMLRLSGHKRNCAPLCRI